MVKIIKILSIVAIKELNDTKTKIWMVHNTYWIFKRKN